MPTFWKPSARNSATFGTFRVTIGPPGYKAVDVTYLRNKPIQVSSYSSTDPFGSATASLGFPQITILDDIGSGELWFLQDYADVNISVVNGATETVVYEGFIASMDWTRDDNGSQLQVQCQGALFQVDHYLAKPFYPPLPWAYEDLIARELSHSIRPDLRTAPLKVQFPSGWTKVAPDPSTLPAYMRPYQVTKGTKVTGYYGRNTGAWEKSLTSYIQGLLNVMLDDQGQQWTLMCLPGRQPVLQVRQMFNITPDHVVYAGQLGIDISVSRDLTQYANVIYGSGTDSAGTEWSRQEVSTDGTTTTYQPLAFDNEVWPADPVVNPRFNGAKNAVEANVKFDNGFDESQALAAAKTMLSRDMDPGLQGTITLKIDTSAGSRYLVKAGQSILVKYMMGTGESGMLFHISQVDVDVNGGTATLKVDTKFRDLLTVEEVLARTRDPLTPVQLLQVGKRSLMIQDQMAPWDYSKGAGFIPKQSTAFFHNLPRTSHFPYRDWSLRYPPKKYPHYYVLCRANAATRAKRWATGIPIRMAEKVDLRLTEVAAYDKNGNVLKIPFHFSVYYNPVSASDMPFDGNGPSPFIPDAFQSTTKYGVDVAAGTPGWTLFADQSMIMGWGNGPQPAGYSPGMKTQGDPATGLLVDETAWSYDAFKNPEFQQNPAAGYRQPELGFTAYCVFYAEYHEPVYFQGRIYRKEPGT